ncbi:SET domain-containing protein [Suillus decipiens]|nr:SET domain-containing protein [Suillus decipiens]
MEPMLLIDGTEEGDLSNLNPQSSKSEYTYTELRELGLRIHKEVWKQFYEWEPGECRHIIHALAGRQVPGEREKYNKMIDQLLDPGAIQDSEMRIDSENPNQPLLVVTQYDAEGRGISYQLGMEEISVNSTFKAHPPYQSCPPINQSIRLPRVQGTVAFIPYGDEEEFPVMEYLDQFQSFAWEEDFDPDSEMIQIETVRRLHNTWNISIKDIDRIRIFPKLLRESYKGGLLWQISQRDFLRWPGGTEDDIEEARYEPAADELHNRLTSVLKTFCPNLNCLRTLCTTHLHPQFGLFGSGRPNATNQGMRLSEGRPCGEECFRLTDESYMDKVYWENESDLKTLRTILSISPDLFPCQLADLCFKPCREVFVQRSHIFPDHMVYDDDKESHTKKKRKTRKPRLIFEEDRDHSPFVPLEPCKHKGPCEKERCECYRRKRHCQLACWCGINCDRQYRGCECKRCTPTCPCYKAERECLPGICEKCDARGATNDPCMNTKLQRNDINAVEIKRGKYGLGAFAVQDMKLGEFIGDYVGDIVTGIDMENVECVTEYSGRNYFFEFTNKNSEEMLDAGPIGNATRFLNHAEWDLANCIARVLLVNGERHIGFYTTKAVARGEELFLWYGDKYWPNKETVEKSSN